MTSQRHEDQTQRMDRHWSELLQELRVIQTGVQLLTGFLLTLPFQARFADLDGVQRVLYLVAVCLAFVATGFVVAPVSIHRVLFRRHARVFLVDGANVLAKLGLFALAASVCVCGALIFSVVVGDVAAVIVATVCALFFAVLWVGVPVYVARTAPAQTPDSYASDSPATGDES